MRAALFLCLFAWPALAADLVGTPTVIDGDTLRFVGAGPRGGTVNVRLYGVSAPELSAWPWGAIASGVLAELVAGQPVTCRMVDADQYGRDVSECWNVAGVALGPAVIAAGAALPYRVFLDQRPELAPPYYEAEAAARVARRGVWSLMP